MLLLLPFVRRVRDRRPVSSGPAGYCIVAAPTPSLPSLGRSCFRRIGSAHRFFSRFRCFKSVCFTLLGWFEFGEVVGSLVGRERVRAV
jgi:hypothetical protein